MGNQQNNTGSPSDSGAIRQIGNFVVKSSQDQAKAMQAAWEAKENENSPTRELGKEEQKPDDPKQVGGDPFGPILALATDYFQDYNDFLNIPTAFPLGDLIKSSVSGGGGGKGGADKASQSSQPIWAMLLIGVLGLLIAFVPQFLPAVLKIVTTLINVIGPIVQSIVNIIGNLVAAIAPYIGPLLMKVVGLIQSLIDYIAPYIGPLLTQLVAMFRAIVDGVVPYIGPLLLKLVGIFETLVAAIAPYIGPLLMKLVEFIAIIVERLVPPIADAIVVLVKLIAGVVPPIIKLVQVIVGLFTSEVAGLFRLVFNGLAQLVPPLTEFAITGLAALSEVRDSIVSFVKTLGSTLETIAKALGESFVTSIQSVAEFVKLIFGSLGTGISNVIGAISWFIQGTLQSTLALISNTMAVVSEGISVLGYVMESAMIKIGGFITNPTNNKAGEAEVKRGFEEYKASMKRNTMLPTQSISQNNFSSDMSPFGYEPLLVLAGGL